MSPLCERPLERGKRRLTGSAIAVMAVLLAAVTGLTALGSSGSPGSIAVTQARISRYRYEGPAGTVEIPSLVFPAVEREVSLPKRGEGRHTKETTARTDRRSPATGPAAAALSATPDVEMVSLKGIAASFGGSVRAGQGPDTFELLLGTEIVRFSRKEPDAVRIRGSVIPLSREVRPRGDDVFLPVDFLARVVTPILRAAPPRASAIPASGPSARPGGGVAGAPAVPASTPVRAPSIVPLAPGATTAAAEPDTRGFVVVLDPGHGGAETGAQGRTGTQEKEVTLDVAKRLKALVERPGVTVLLTRNEDGVVALDDRTALANQNHADLFLSIHVNSAPRHDARGAETYFLSYKSKDEDIRTLAAMENNASGVDREKMGQVPQGLDLVLWDLAQAHDLEESSRLAETIQKQLNDALGVRNRGVKQAPFRVLMGATMPAVLVEVGFISNPAEETSLKSGEYRDKIAQALARAVGAFLSENAKPAGRVQ